MSKRKTTGKLSKEAEQFITEYSSKMSPKDIADKIGKSEATVNRYIAKHGLTKYGQTYEQKKMNRIRHQLHMEPFWAAIKDNYNDREIAIFEELWIGLFMQFEDDVTSTEKLQIHKYLTLFLQRERSINKQTIYHKMIQSLGESIDIEKRKHPDDRSDALIGKLADNMTSLTDEVKGLVKEIKDFSEQESKIETSLKGTRDQRIKEIANATKNWSSIVALLQSPQLRKKVGFDLEIRRKAKEKAKETISAPHQFADKSVSIPLLTSETIEGLDLEDYTRDE